MQKDVKLVITAQDKASRATKAIASTIDSFVRSVNDAGRGSDKSATRIEKLGGALAGLQKQFRGQDVGDTLSSSLDRAVAASERLDRKLAQTTEAHTGLTQAQRRAAFTADEFERKTEGANAAVDRQKALVRESKDSLNALAAATRVASTAKDRAARSDERTNAALQKQQGILATAKQRYADLSTEIQSSDGPTKRLLNSQRSAANAIASTAARIEKLTTEQAENRQELQLSERRYDALREATLSANTAFAQQEGVLDKIKTNASELKAQLRSAASEQNRLEKAQDQASTSLERGAAAAQKAEQGLAEYRQEARTTEQAMDRLRKAVGDEFAAEINQQSNAMARSRGEMFSAQRTALQLRNTIESFDGPLGGLRRGMQAAFGNPEQSQRALTSLTELRDRLTRAEAAAAAAAAQADVQRQGLVALGAIADETGGDISQLADRQNRFVEAQERTQSSLAASRAAFGQTVAAQSAQVASTTRLSQESNRLDTSLDGVARANTRAGRASQIAAKNGVRQSEAYKELYGDSRRALSITQRLRGQVLSLVAAYGGFFGAIQGIRQVIEGYQRLEGIQNRILVLTDGNEQRADQEFSRLRSEADRLGISFADLAEEYTQFAIAAKDSNLEGRDTRDIFTAVAEAGRVLNLDAETMSGTFKALTQIMSKGKIQAEELRGQLGDRLPGAVRLLAAGMGVTTAELEKMLEQGQITADSLIPLADELNRVYGPQLGAALQKTNAELGRTQTAIFFTLKQFAEAGFLESFTDLLRDLQETLRDNDFQAFVAQLSRALGVVLDVLGLVIRNFDVLIIALAALAGLKVHSVIALMSRSLAQTTARLKGAALGSNAFTAAMQKANVQMALGASRSRVLATRLLALAGAARTALAALAGPAIIIGLAVAMATAATSASSLEDALFDLEEETDKVEAAFVDAGGDADAFAKSLEEVDTSTIRRGIATLRDELADLRRDFIITENQLTTSRFFSGAFFKDGLTNFVDQKFASELLKLADAGDETAVGLAQIATAYKNNELAAKDFIEQAEGLRADTQNQGLLDYIDRLQERAKEALPLVESLNKAQEATELASGLRGSDGLTAFERRAEEERKRQAEIDKKSETGGTEESKETKKTRDFIAATKAAIENQKLLNDGKEEQARIQQTINAARERDPGISEADLAKVVALTEELNTLEELQEKIEASDALSGSIKQAAEDAAFELSLAGKTNSERKLAVALREAEANATADNIELSQEDLELVREKVRLEEEAASAQAVTDFRENLQKSLADKQFQVDLLGEETLAREVLTAVREAEKAAQEAGTKLTDDERASVVRLTEALYAQQAAEEAVEATRERAAAAQDSLSAIQARVGAVNGQLALAQVDGDQDAVERLRSQLFSVNAELFAGINNARIMWSAVGGEEAQVALERLNLLEAEAMAFADAADDVSVRWQDVAASLDSNLERGFDSFFDRVAEGGNIFKSVLSSFREFAQTFLREIASMIVQQAIFNRLRQGGGQGGGVFGGIASSLFSFFHSGGIAGSPSRMKSVNPAAFAGATRYHDGGIAGLAPNEVPAILEQGEEVLTTMDPRHRNNARGGADGGMSLTNINVFDVADMLTRALETAAGSDALINFVNKNGPAIQGALNES